jgi:hypothetical protein
MRDETELKNLVLSCIGATVTKVHFSGGGGIEWTFSNGITIEYNDGYCHASRDGLHIISGSIYE